MWPHRDTRNRLNCQHFRSATCPSRDSHNVNVQNVKLLILRALVFFLGLCPAHAEKKTEKKEETKKTKKQKKRRKELEFDHQ